MYQLWLQPRRSAASPYANSRCFVALWFGACRDGWRRQVAQEAQESRCSLGARLKQRVAARPSLSLFSFGCNHASDAQPADVAASHPSATETFSSQLEATLCR